MHAPFSIATLAVLLAACTTATPSMTDQQPATADTCNADAAQSLAGQVATTEVVARARQLAGAQTARVLKPDQMVTLEYLAGRLNVYVDANNVITRISCG